MLQDYGAQDFTELFNLPQQIVVGGFDVLQVAFAAHAFEPQRRAA